MAAKSYVTSLPCFIDSLGHEHRPPLSLRGKGVKSMQSAHLSSAPCPVGERQRCQVRGKQVGFLNTLMPIAFKIPAFYLVRERRRRRDTERGGVCLLLFLVPDGSRGSCREENFSSWGKRCSTPEAKGGQEVFVGTGVEIGISEHLFVGGLSLTCLG